MRVFIRRCKFNVGNLSSNRIMLIKKKCFCCFYLVEVFISSVLFGFILSFEFFNRLLCLIVY